MNALLGTLRELCDGWVFDPSLVDLVVAYPYLSWNQFGASLVLVVGWKWTTDRAERFVIYHLRRFVARMLMRLALLVRPVR